MSNSDLGTLGGLIENFENFTVSTGDTSDIFEFDLFGTREVSLYLHNLSGGDADLFLYEDSNDNGSFDSSDTLVASSTFGGSSADFLTYSADAGTYFVEVEYFSGGTVTYDLDVVATRDLGLLDPQVVSRDLDLFPSDPGDTFEFDISGVRNVNLNLHNISGNGDADLFLYRDANGNGLFDSDDLLVGGSNKASNDDDAINRVLITGTYFVQVLRFDAGSDGVVDYNLDLSSTARRQPSNLLPKEASLGQINSSTSVNGRISSGNTSDVGSFSLGGSSGGDVGIPSGVTISLTGLSSDADLRVIHDANNNRIVDAGEVIGSSTNINNLSESITITDSGDYFVQVYQFSGNTDYTLSFDYFT